jgi:NDP-sugar pyrophosphorylase family protein
MHLVIVAGGLGSRLAPLTNNIPKFLVNIGKQTGFVEQIRYWKQYHPSSITVIVHSAYKDLVQAYYDLYFKDDEELQVLDIDAGEQWTDAFKPTPLHVKTVDAANGSAHAIMSTCDHLANQPVLFTWCDVLPAVPFCEDDLVFGGAYAFLNYDHPNRYDLVQIGKAWSSTVPRLREDGRGGIFGMYYVSLYKPVPFIDGQDFVELLPAYDSTGYVQGVKLDKIIDFGDKPKLERVRATADKSREFNKVEIHGDLVLKSALNKQGETLIKREIAWYNLLNESCDTSVTRPTHWPAGDRHSFVMTRVEGVPIWELWPTLDEEGRRLVLGRLLQQFKALHSTRVIETPERAARADVQMEAHTKLLSRYNEIKDVIGSFGEVHTVNGWLLMAWNSGYFKPENTINQLFAFIENQYDHSWSDTVPYSLIHGDLQMSNAMINPDTMEITLIDPRGYFGNTSSFGLPDYDYGKLLYSLNGYDLFNYSHDFHITRLSNGRLDFTIPQPDIGGCEDLIKNTFTVVHIAWLAVCYIGLAQYIKNDPVKSLCAHYHGMALADKVLTGDAGFNALEALGYDRS